MTTAIVTINDVLGRLHDVKPAGRGKWKALCPAHDDANPSLSVAEGDGGRVLIHCHAGCAYSDIMAAIGLSVNGNGANSAATTQVKTKAQPARRIVATYDYHDAAGQVIFQKVRYEPKDFAQRRPDGNSGYIWGLGDVAPVLYRLPRLLDPATDWQPVYICEGEKDVDRLARLGITATCNFDGAAKAGQKTKWRPAEYNEHIAGRVVYILADNDDAGRAHAAAVADSLQGVAQAVKVVNLPGLPDKGDVSDWLDAGHTKEDLERECLLTEEWQPAADATPAQAQPVGAAIDASSPAAVSLSERLPPVDTQLIVACYDREELGDGELFSHLYRGRVVYDHSEKVWLFWDGNHYRRDDTGQINLLYSGQVAAQYLEGAATATIRANEWAAAGDKIAAKTLTDAAQGFARRARQLQKKTRMSNALEYAKSTLGVTGDAWDICPGYLPVANGIVDLATGQLQPGRPGDYIRTYAPHEWRGLDERCPRFEKSVYEIMGGNERMVAFLQRLLGYGISGLATEHRLPIFHGETGRNGKDTVVESVGYALGPLAGAVTKDVVIDPGGKRYSGAATPHLMELQGKRLVWASEPKEGARLDAAQVKLITGGGRLKGRPLYGKEVEWQPSHLVMLITNPRPHAPADDLALWERILLIPFTQRFVDNPKGDNEHAADKGLRASLRTEASGILSWLVRGFMEWRRVGLNPPPEVTQATADYRQAEDSLSLFLNERYTPQDGAKVAAKDTYEDYVAWCNVWGVSPMQGITFGEKMKSRLAWKRETVGIFYLGISRNYP